MVQYIHTPWRDRAELLKVRRQFYPSPPPGTDATITSNPASSSYTTATTTNLAAASSALPHAREPRRDDEAEAGQRHAVSRVSVWVQRGSCPHMVESTGLLMAAILDDLREARMGSNSSTSAIRLAYSAAFSRYVVLPLPRLYPRLLFCSLFGFSFSLLRSHPPPLSFETLLFFPVARPGG
jgi:ribosomal biogenesis protein LAS1